MKSERTKATSIPTSVKQKVWERDGKRCLFCHTPYASPEAHIIARSQGGMGVDERNIITVCRFCHYKLDSGSTEERRTMRAYAKRYLEKKYGKFADEEVKYKKHG